MPFERDRPGDNVKSNGAGIAFVAPGGRILFLKRSGGGDHKDGGAKKPRAHGPVENRREFRRKSG